MKDRETKMRKHDDCKFFGSLTLCLHGKDELMRQFLCDSEILESPVPITRDFSKAEEVDNLCFTCPKFESIHQSVT
jgi:hypothetical protein